MDVVHGCIFLYSMLFLFPSFLPIGKSNQPFATNLKPFEKSAPLPLHRKQGEFMIREMTCEIENESVLIQIGEDFHKFSREEADVIYAILSDSCRECDEEVILKGIRMNGEEAYRLLEVMEEAIMPF